MISLHKTFRVVFEEKEKQQKQREKGCQEQAVTYVDTNRSGLILYFTASIILYVFRNISVVLESKDLSEDFEEEGLNHDPSGPNSKVYILLRQMFWIPISDVPQSCKIFLQQKRIWHCFEITWSSWKTLKAKTWRCGCLDQEGGGVPGEWIFQKISSYLWANIKAERQELVIYRKLPYW